MVASAGLPAPTPRRSPRRATWLLLALTVALIGCSPLASPSLTRSPSAAPAAGSQAASPLEGRWATGSIPIADIKASMVAAGISAVDVDKWVTEVGSPSAFSFVLDFAGDTFTHSEATPDTPMQVGELGAYRLSGAELVLAPGEAGNIDTYTLAAKVSGDNLSLRWVGSTEEGTAEAKETHKRFTIAFYCSAVFKRVGR